MRGVASYLAGTLTLVTLLAAGGAWAPSYSVALRAAEIPAEVVSFGLVADFDARTAEDPVRQLPPGCVGPVPGATCATTVVAGGLDVPETVADLVPESPESVKDWRPLVASFFEPRHVSRALRIIWCESKGDPNAENPTSTASGLFQHLGSLWEERTAEAAMEGADIFDPVANTAMAAWLVYEAGGWSHWNASRSCWRGS